MDDQNQDVQEAVVVEETDTTITNSDDITADGGEATVLFSLEEMIKKNISSVDKMKNELKQAREMFEDSFVNNPTYRENTEKAKEAIKAKSTTRQQIASQPSVIQVSNKIKSLRGEIKERQDALSDYLQEYQRLSGATQIEGEDGKVRQIINKSSLVVVSSK